MSGSNASSGVMAAVLLLLPQPSPRPGRGAENAVIAIPNGAGGIGFDDLRFSPTLNRVLVPAGRTGSLVLIDPATRETTVIGGFSGKSGYAGGHGDGITSVDEGRGVLFVTDRSSGELDVVDPASGTIVSRAKLASIPDYVRYATATNEVWVTQPDKERIEVFRFEKSPAPPVHAGFISVPGGPESLVIDSKKNRAYTHTWTGSTFSIDVVSRSIGSQWPNGCVGSRGIALDEARGFLFVGCAEGKAVVLEAATGKTLSTAKAGDGVDIIEYAPNLSHLYFPGGKSATMATFAVSSKGKLSLLGMAPTAEGAHCVTADLDGNAYVCAPRKGDLLVIRDPYRAMR